MKKLLSCGLFEKDFMNSKATTNSVSTKEWVLGHLIGPLGLIFVVNTIAALVEKFFTQQTGAMYGVANVEMIQQMGGVYEIVMTAAKVLAVGMGLLNGWLIQRTESKQGRMRPWHLIFGFVSIHRLATAAPFSTGIGCSPAFNHLSGRHKNSRSISAARERKAVSKSMGPVKTPIR